MKINCKYCLIEFEAKRSTATFCSDSHRTLFGNLSDKEKDVREKELNDINSLPDKIEVLPRTNLLIDKKGIKEVPSKEVNNKVKETMDKINKDFGSGTIMLFGDKPSTEYQVVSTGSLTLDLALGIGGLPMGRMVEIYGWESSGKTTIALNVFAHAQKKGLRCLLIDAENAFDPEYANSLGVNVDELQYCQPSNGEQALEVADRQMCAGQVDVIVVDSVAALVPKAELEGEMGDSKMGLHARLMSQACRKMIGSVAKHNVLFIWINQFRHKIGGYGNPEVTCGGNALQFYASIRMEVSRSLSKENAVMNGDVKEGNQTTVKVIKNKCSPPFRKAQFNIMYGTGIDRKSEIIDLAIDFKVIKKSSSWFYYNESQIGQGKDSVKEMLNNNPEIYLIIEKEIMKIAQA